MPRSRQASRHWRPCGRMRRLQNRNWASKCASSCRSVRSISVAPNFCKAGLSEMRQRRKSARPTVVRMRLFHSTRRRTARPFALRARKRQTARSFNSRADGREKISGASKLNSSCLNGDRFLAAFRIRSLHNLRNNPRCRRNFFFGRVFPEGKPDC